MLAISEKGNCMPKKKDEIDPVLGELIREYAKQGVGLDEVALLTGLTPYKIDKFYKHYWSLGNVEGLRLVKGKAMEMALSGLHPTMTIFYLKSQAKWYDRPDINAEKPSEKAGNLAQKVDTLKKTKDPIEASRLYQKIMMDD